MLVEDAEDAVPHGFAGAAGSQVLCSDDPRELTERP